MKLYKVRDLVDYYFTLCKKDDPTLNHQIEKVEKHLRSIYARASRLEKPLLDKIIPDCIW